MVESNSDRRVYPRFNVSWPVQVEAPTRLVIDTHDYDREQRRFYLRGTTVNLSRGGALVRLDPRLEGHVNAGFHWARVPNRGRRMRRERECTGATRA